LQLYFSMNSIPGSMQLSLYMKERDECNGSACQVVTGLVKHTNLD